QQGREQSGNNGNDDFLRGGLGHLGVRIGHEIILGGGGVESRDYKESGIDRKGRRPGGWTARGKPAMLRRLCARSSAG
ncbi:hypothetical protein, partial [Thiobacillus sp.]|uniref:hypothetical protein n=1 Tax=Thiobacillus sp. TaxID=924 RepID=UPI0025EEDB94